MSFKKNNYFIIKKAIDKDLALFLFNYLVMKKQVFDTCIKYKYFSPFETICGGYEAVDEQIPNTYCAYADIAMDTLLLKLQPLIEKKTGEKLNPSYSYTRAYKKGDVLYRHRDRASCEISTTINLGGEPWPIYLDPTKGNGILSGKDQNVVLKPNAKKGVKVNLKPGDMLIYRGCELDHWREKFKGNICVQVFLHFNNKKNPIAKTNIFDTKIHLGLPPWFKGQPPK
jgi:hypothetical protein|tara:strand:+ start:226 stop:906 length:681 start_codon:yes stop_codon:yes gene_type:complete